MREVTEIVLDVDNCDVEMLPLPANLPKSVVTVQRPASMAINVEQT